MNEEKLSFGTTTVHSIIPGEDVENFIEQKNISCLALLTTSMMMKEKNRVLSPKKSSPIDRLKRIFHFRDENSLSNSIGKKKASKAERAIKWQEDEKAVRAGTCSFHVKVNPLELRIIFKIF